MCPPGRRCAFFNWLLTRLNFSASTTDRHAKCTDDVVTEMCRIFVDMLQMSSMFFFFFVFIVYHPWSSSWMTFHIKLLSVSRVCFVLTVCVCVSSIRTWQATVGHPAPVCVFMSYHLIDVNLEAPSESWQLSGNVTIPINVHQSD